MRYVFACAGALMLAATAAFAQSGDWKASSEAGMQAARQGRHAEAETHFKQAIEQAEKAKAAPAVAANLSNLGFLYAHMKKYEAAREHFTRAMKMIEAALGSDHPEVGALLVSSAQVSILEGKVADAEPNLVRATAILAKADKTYQPILGAAYNYLGLVRAAQKRHAEADTLYKRALGIVEKAFGRDHANLASILDNHAETLVALNRADEAGAAKVRAINIRRKTRSQEKS